MKLIQHCWNYYHIQDCTKTNNDRTQNTEHLQKIEDCSRELTETCLNLSNVSVLDYYFTITRLVTVKVI